MAHEMGTVIRSEVFPSLGNFSMSFWLRYTLNSRSDILKCMGSDVFHSSDFIDIACKAWTSEVGKVLDHSPSKQSKRSCFHIDILYVIGRWVGKVILGERTTNLDSHICHATFSIRMKMT